jgi:Uma2 family endonuclease
VISQERLYTIADLRQIESLPGNEHKRFELLKGMIFEVAYPTPAHNIIVGNLYITFQLHAKTHDLGQAFTDSVSYTLGNGDEFAPDVSFIAKARLPEPLPDRFFFAPDLAVEVASPSNRERELLDKAEALLENGTRLVWIIYPTKQIVDIPRLLEDGSLNTRKFDLNGIIELGDVLPGLTLDVKDIFGK